MADDSGSPRIFKRHDAFRRIISWQSSASNEARATENGGHKHKYLQSETNRRSGVGRLRNFPLHSLYQLVWKLLHHSSSLLCFLLGFPLPIICKFPFIASFFLFYFLHLLTIYFVLNPFLYFLHSYHPVSYFLAAFVLSPCSFFYLLSVFYISFYYTSPYFIIFTSIFINSTVFTFLFFLFLPFIHSLLTLTLPWILTLLSSFSSPHFYLFEYLTLLLTSLFVLFTLPSFIPNF